MVDIHSHILPDLDDGSRTFSESVQMLALAVESGTTDIVASPHSDLRYRYDRAVVASKIEELQEACPEIRIHRGCDFHLIPERIHEALMDPAAYSINGRGFLLVEFPDALIPDSTDDLLERMITCGLTPVLTHPERNRILQRDPERIHYWVDHGCLVQITAQSLLGRFGRTAARVSRELLDARLVHFVASDGHDTDHRPPVLSEAFHTVVSEYGQETAILLFQENPARALVGAPVAAPSKFRKRLVWRWFGK